MQKSFLRSIIIISLLLGVGINVLAIDEKYKSLPLDGASGQIKKDSISIVSDTVFFNGPLYSTVVNTYSVQNIITFKINEYANRVLPDSFKVKLKFTVNFTNNLNQIIIKNDSLTIDYHRLKSYTGKAVFTQTGFHRSSVKLTDVIPIYGDSSVFLSSLMLENEIWISRDYQFNCSNDAIHTISFDNSAVSTNGELKVFWNKQRNADEYDLEWSYIDSTAFTNYYFPSTTNFDPDKIFDDNTTRVSVITEDYDIPLLYDNGGVIFFRVRPVQVKPNGQRIEATWSSDYVPDGGMGTYSYAGHERTLNWQSTTTFAEGGLRKSVVQYFDGLLKARQLVTKDNTTGTTVVAETLYDFQGQPVIQVLPSPTLNTMIQFTPDFNLDINGAEYDKTKYDFDIEDPDDFCSRGAEAMGTQDGASQYYSPANAQANDGFHRFIPNANGFPFTETVYEQDNSGRIRKQSGVGSTHKIGSGHETTYYYGSADQEELDALFGTEVGTAAHYFKNMVRDANGQYTVSYVDMRGRTVATALAGDNPSTLDKLSSNTLRTITKKLLDKTNNQIKGTSIESSKALLVPKAGNHSFSYSLTPDSLTLATCRSTNICYDCMYDLEITISDDCNNAFNNGNPVRLSRSNVSINNPDTVCNSFQPFPQADTTVFLPEGSYLITKKLTISKSALEQYRDSVFLKKNTCKTLEEFIEEEKEILRNQLVCQPTCQSCVDSLGTWETFRPKFMSELGIGISDTASYRPQALLAYSRQQAACNELCLQTGLHHSIRQAMLMDVTAPYGQYANTDNIDKYSIFYRDGENSPFTFQKVTETYLDQDGRPDSIVNQNGVRVPPNHNSITVDDFEKNFKPSWAESLLSSHPEYCKLQLIESAGFAASYLWDERFERIETYQAALDSGFLNPTAKNTAPFSQFTMVASKKDPFFDAAVNPTYANTWRAVIESKMVQPQAGSTINIWSLATAMTKCAPDDDDCFDYFVTNSHAFEFDAECTGDKDMAWRTFRELYLNEKRKIIDQILGGLPCNANQIDVPPHNLNFPKFETTSQGGGEPTSAAGRDSLNKFVDENCRNYATQWWNQMKPCGFVETDSALIISRLVQVCKEGGDESRPYGASSVKPGSTFRFKSFKDVITQYADSVGIYLNNSACNVYLITDPAPYEKPLSYSDIEQWTKPDDCQCDVISNLFANYQSQAGDHPTFSSYVNKNLGINISENNLQTLRNLCNGSIECNFLSEAITIPAALQCGAQPPCLSCDQMAGAYSQFLIEYPNNHIIAFEDTLMKLEYYLFLEKYLNAKLGYKKTYKEYFDFLESCNIPYLLPSEFADINPGATLEFPTTGSNPVEGVTCDSLENVLSQFNALFPTVSTYNLVTVRYRKELYPYDEYLLNCTGTGGTTGGQTTNPAKWRGSGTRITTSHWYRNNLTFMRFNFRAVNGRHTIDSIILRMSPVLSEPFQPLVSVGNMSTFWDSTLLCSDLGVSFWGGKTEVYTPLYQYNSSAGNTIYNYNVRSSMLNLIRFPDTYRGNLLTSDLNPAVSASNNVTFLGSSDSIVIADPETAPRIVVEYKVDTIYRCEDLITGFFNYRLNSNLTFDSLKSLFLQRCGTVLPVSCQPSDTNRLCGRNEAIFPIKYVEQYSPCEDSTNFAVDKATIRYEAYMDSLERVFEQRYLAKCLGVANSEVFNVAMPVNEYHYTLYYYDQAGNLVKTIPPAGVDVSKFGWARNWSDSVKNARTNGQVLKPVHVLQTNYRYNTLNQVVAQSTPDAGLSTFWYDRLGRLVISQNAKQRTGANENNRYYSFSKYDYLGRLSETGQGRNPTSGATGMTDNISRDPALLESWISIIYSRLDNTVRNYYDVPKTIITGQLSPTNLRNRLAQTAITYGNNTTAYNHATFYSYDIHGNVDTLVQDYGNSTASSIQNVMNRNGNRWKKLVYEYDLISGKVNATKYQDGQKDAFYHRYEYDADNRLTNTYSSLDRIIWEQDARYSYYKHGPLARTIIGEQMVQGIDYAYTLQGWLKGVNSTSLNPGIDMGEDGNIGAQNQYITRDVLSFNLNYYTGDYSAISAVNLFPGTSAYMGVAYKPLYNGNISSMAVNIAKFNHPLLYSYSYDQLNRLTGVDVFDGLNQADNHWTAMAAKQDYKERISYDANGNILTYLRQGYGANLAMDSLAYKYTYSGDRLQHNKLNYVRDRISGSTAHSANYTEDIEDQSINNYTYDAIGNLASDVKEGITAITWNVFGKATEIQRTPTVDNPVNNIQYTYDAQGLRISKRVAKNTTSTVEYTWYVRDATGNILATYTSLGTGTTLTSYSVALTEQHIYGTARIGVLTRSGIDMKTAFTPGNYRAYNRGLKTYELSNHLGNILVSISDKKSGHNAGGGFVDYFEAEIINASDYYSGGMAMVGRQFNLSAYGYGFQQQQKSFELNREGNNYTNDGWEYDARLGRRWNTDNVVKHFISPYSAYTNNPIARVDPDGNDDFFINEDGTWDIIINGSKKHTFNFVTSSGTVKYLAYRGVLTGNHSKNWDFHHQQILWKLYTQDEDFQHALSVYGEEEDKADNSYEYTDWSNAFSFKKGFYKKYYSANGDWLKDLDRDAWANNSAEGISYLENSVSESILAGGVFKLLKSGIISKIWAAAPLKRGMIIEKILANTKYLGTKYVGKLVDGKFPGFDFYKTGLAISLKTTNAAKGYGNIYSNIRQLAKMIRKGGYGSYNFTRARIDVVVPKGFDKTKLDNLIRYAERKGGGNIKIEISEL